MIAGLWLFNIQDNIQDLIINKKIQANEIGKKFMNRINFLHVNMNLK